MNKRGVSPVIAVVLLIIIVLVIALIVYIYATEEVDEALDTATSVYRTIGTHEFLVESTDLNHVSIRNMGEKIEFDGTTEADFLEIFDMYVNVILQSSGVIDSFTTANGDTTWERSEALMIDFNETNIKKGDLIWLVHKDSATTIPLRVS